MLSINISELIWTIINFFLLYFVLKRFLFDPVGRLLDAREAKVDEGLNAEKQAEEAVQANREKLAAEKAESRLEASRILSEAESEGETRRSESLKDAHRKASDALREGELRLAQQSVQDEALLQEKRGELSALLTERILGRED